MSEKSKKIGILWGGGLGDLLVIRPLLLALQADPSIESYLMTTAVHLTGLFNELCSPTEVVLLPRRPGKLRPYLKKWRGFFDVIYIGPHPTVKTRILGHLLAPGKLWSRKHNDRPAYMLEQVLADITDLGLPAETTHQDFATFLPWKAEKNLNPFNNDKPFLVLHPGAKQGWTTTLWPIEQWQALIAKLLQETEYSLCLVGVASEQDRYETITGSLPEQHAGRVKLCLSWPLQDTAALISSSAGVICHNSGIMHLSTFFQKKTICITGASAGYWQPPYPWVANVTSGACTLACNCYRCPVPFSRARCIHKLDMQMVWLNIMRLLGGNGNNET